MSENKVEKNNFEVEVWADGKSLPLNHMMQELIANVSLALSKSLKGLEKTPETFEIKIKSH